jgi:hypothetical protein
MVLDPLYLDTLWRLVTFELAGSDAQEAALRFPYAIETLLSDGPLPDELWARIESTATDEAGDRPLRITLHDAKGAVRLLLDGVLARPFDALDEIRAEEEVAP